MPVLALDREISFGAAVEKSLKQIAINIREGVIKGIARATAIVLCLEDCCKVLGNYR